MRILALCAVAVFFLVLAAVDPQPPLIHLELIP